MTDIRVPENCENSPKSLLVRDFYIAFFSHKVDDVLHMVTPDFQCVIYGDETYTGHEGMRTVMNKLEKAAFTSISLDLILSHGKYVVCNGTGTMKDGTRMAFSETFTFESHAKDAHIQKLESYTIIL